MKKINGLWDEINIQDIYGLNTSELPDSIDEVDEQITTKQLICPQTKLPFNIAPQELVFYREQDIPLPRHHFDYRTLERFKPLTVIVPYQGSCFLCEKEITHFYLPERDYKKIACVACYQQEVI